MPGTRQGAGTKHAQELDDLGGDRLPCLRIESRPLVFVGPPLVHVPRLVLDLAGEERSLGARPVEHGEYPVVVKPARPGRGGGPPRHEPGRGP